MLRIIGIILLMCGSVGVGFSYRKRMKENLHTLYQLRQIFKMLQNEIIYSKASLPEACRRLGNNTQTPFKEAFEEIYQEMTLNNGRPFSTIWKQNMYGCLKKLPISEEDKKVCLSFGDCVGFIDEKMQAEAIEQYMHNLNLSVKKLEDDMTNKSKVIMSLSIMGGLLVAIILI